MKFTSIFFKTSKKYDYKKREDMPKTYPLSLYFLLLYEIT